MDPIERTFALPQEWRVVRGLLKAIGLLALWATTNALLSDLPGPAYFVAPGALMVTALLVGLRFRRVRVPAFVVAFTSTVTLVSHVWLYVLVKDLSQELREAFRSCDDLAECRTEAAAKFRGRRPRLPTGERVVGYRFAEGNDGGRLFAFWYAPAGSEQPTLLFAVSRRRPGGFEPPADTSGFLDTPGGTAYVRSDQPGTTRVDFWDDSFHYAVTHTGGDEAAVIALVDSLK